MTSAILTVHILSAITAFGTNITYFVWFRRALNNPGERAYTLATIRMLEVRFVNPSYVLAGITGLWLIERTGQSFNTAWIELSIVIFIVIMAVGGLVYRPILKRQIQLADEPDSEEYRKVDRRGNILGIIVTALVVFLIYLMVDQPAFWD